MLPEMWGYDAGPKKQEIALTPTILELRDENDHGIEGWIDGSRSHTLDAFALCLFFFLSLFFSLHKLQIWCVLPTTVWEMQKTYM